MLYPLKILYKLPAQICSNCQKLTLHQHFSKTVSVSGLQPLKKPVKKIKKTDSPKHLVDGSRSSKIWDPIHPVAEKLLRSLAKRHQTNFSVPAASFVVRADDSLSTISTQDLICAIYALPSNAPEKQEMMKSIEKLLIKRLYKMPLELTLEACHAFYIRRHDFHQFFSHVFSVIEEIFDTLSPSTSQITYLLLYVFVQGSAPPMLLYRVEEYLLKNLEDFHINDLGIICAGFFRGNSRLSSQDLIAAISDKLLREMDEIEPITLLNFVKMFRHAGFVRVSFYEKFADYLVQNNFLLRYETINPLMHIAFTYASISVQHIQLFERLFDCFEKLVTRQKNIRTKDLSKFVWACGTLQFRPDNYRARYEHLIKCFEVNGSQSRDFPESCAELLMGLVYLGIFHEDLLRQCLSPKMVNKLTDGSFEKEKSIQLLLLNETVKIECPSYTINDLSKGQIAALMKHPSMFRDLSADLRSRIGLLVAVNLLKQCLGADKVHCVYPLLHFKTAVIELRYCKQDGFISFIPCSSQHVSSLQQNDTFTHRAVSDSLFSALTSGHSQVIQVLSTEPPKKLAILVSSSNQYALNNTNHMLGHLHTMKRQLEQLCYVVAEICPQDALQLELSSHEQRCRCLSTLLSSALHDNITLS